MMKIEDDFLDQDDFDKLQKLLMGSEMPWFYSSGIDSLEDVDKFQFVHVFYTGASWASDAVFLKILNPIVFKIKPLTLWRIKANLLTKTLNIVENTFHTDIGDLHSYPEKLKQWTTSIFYVNTNNGYTEFEDGVRVESVANRKVTFPSNIKHRGTSCTDEKTRVVINFNYQ